MIRAFRARKIFNGRYEELWIVGLRSDPKSNVADLSVAYEGLVVQNGFLMFGHLFEQKKKKYSFRRLIKK